MLIGAIAKVNGPSETLCLLYDHLDFTPEVVMRGYMQGMFPSAIHISGATRWHAPDPRGIMPIHSYHVEKELQRIIRQKRFEIRGDHDLRAIMAGCAAPAPGRETTFITPAVMDVYCQLFEMRAVHCLGAYQDGALVGGLWALTSPARASFTR